MENRDLYCPIHKVKLVLKEAKQGKNIGQKFWGCPTWSKTKCTYTVSYKTKSKKLSKQKLSDKIRNKDGKISPIKVIGLILMIPIYVVGFLISFVMGVFPNRKSGF